MLESKKSGQIITIPEPEVLYSVAGNEFDEFLELVSVILRVPVSFISFKNGENIFFKSKGDINDEYFLQVNTFCDLALKNPDSVFEISNASEGRFYDNPLVTQPPAIIFFAAVPLIIPGSNDRGTLCIMDYKTRKLKRWQIKALKILGKKIVNKILVDKNLSEQRNELISAHKKLFEITSQTPDYIFTLDKNLNITYINHFENDTKPGDIINKSVLDYIDKDYIQEYYAASQIAFNELRVVEKEILIRTSKDEKRWYSVKFCPIKNEDGNADSLLVIANDVIVSRQVRQELLKQQRILFEAQKLSQTGSCEWDIKTGEAIFSSEIYNIFSFEKNSEKNHIHQLSDLVHPDDQPLGEKLIINAIKTFSSLVFKYRVITPKGELKYIDGRGFPLLIRDNKVITVLLTLQDITASVNFDKKLFTAVVQSEEKERARMAGELHDGVCQYLAGSRLMFSGIERSFNNKEEDLDVESILSMVTYGKKSVDDALVLTRQISHNLLPVEFHEKGVIKSIQEIAESLNTADEIKYVVTAQGIDANLDQNISINIFRIVQEFIRNSQKYSEATEVKISITIDKKSVALEISDNGKGFDLKYEEKKGVGLLSMRKRIESVGGSFNYETAPGKGVRLTLKMAVE